MWIRTNKIVLYYIIIEYNQLNLINIKVKAYYSYVDNLISGQIVTSNPNYFELLNLTQTSFFCQNHIKLV